MDLYEKLGIFSILVVSFLTLFMKYRIYKPMEIKEYDIMMHLGNFIGLCLLITMIFILAYYVYSTYRILIDEEKFIMIDLVITFFLIPIALIFVLIREIDLLVFGTTAVTFEFFGPRYIDPIAFSMFITIISFSAYFYFLWSLKMSHRFSESYAYLGLVAYIIIALLGIHPDNNYSNYIEYVTPIKILSRLALFIGFTVPAILIILEVRKRIKTAETLEKVVRMEILSVANFLLIISLLFWFIDGLIESTYTIFIIASDALFFIAFLGVSISVIWPEWFSKIIVKKA